MDYLDLDAHCPRQAIKFNHSLPTKIINAAVFLPEEFVMPHMNTPIDSQQFRFFCFNH